MTTTVQAGATSAPAAGPAITEPGIYQMTNEEYHADRGSLSSSGARKLLPPSCPALFRHAQDTPQEPKKTFELGRPRTSSCSAKAPTSSWSTPTKGGGSRVCRTCNREAVRRYKKAKEGHA
jgi:hypothetical protein